MQTSFTPSHAKPQLPIKSLPAMPLAPRDPRPNAPGQDSELVIHGYKTNDRVHLAGQPQKKELKTIRISGTPPLLLNNREFLVLLALYFHARRRKYLQAGYPVGTGDYITCKAIIATIDKIKIDYNSDVTSLENATEEDIRRVVARLRRRLMKNGNNPNLNETARGYGYRLSSPSQNIEWPLDPQL